ncbi:hypothetical protein LZC95_41715 [Pendulispora brunnea]|uniref:Lipoprotein n=1 Tax=Pendulispora brunnea TaxID=2905690 RepID=A0ABZ2K2L3_9BACT
MGTKMMQGRMAGISMALVSFLGGCGVAVSYVPLNPPPREMHARLPADVEFFDGKEPSQPYVEVGTIDARRRQSNGASKEELFAEIRQMAASHGCDGVKVIGNLPIGRLGYRAACIVYRPSAVATTNADEAKAAAPAAPVTTLPKAE